MAELAAATACALGEGPLWHAGALWFVDIKAPAIHRLDPADDALTTWPAPEQVGFIAPTVRGDWIAGLKSGLHRFDPTTGSFTPFLTGFEDPALDNRLNDGLADAQGRLWFGSMHDGERNPSGVIYRLDARGLAPVADGIAITNGPCVTADGETLYYTDTLARRIWVCRLDAAGEVVARQVFVEIEASAGNPDGSILDAEDCLWVALWGGGAARRYAPDGRLLQTVALPASQITKLAFGGPDLKTAFATSARKGLSPEALAKEPQAGGVFGFEVAVPGRPAGVFAG